MSELNFGIFKDFWDGFPYHLPILNLYSSDNESSEWKLSKGLERLDYFCDNHDQELIIEGIHKLLQDENWRPHLVAIMASFKLSPAVQEKLIPDFWSRLEKGSWVSPQILSVLSMIDKEFEGKAKEILKTGFSVNFSPLDMAEHHTARGPEGSKEASEKVIRSIKLLLENKNDSLRWKVKLIQLIETNKFKIHTKDDDK